MDKADSIRETRQDKEQAIKVIKDRIRTYKLLIDITKKEYLKANAPKGYSSGSSYEDYDTIHGDKKDYSMDRLALEIAPYETQIKLDRMILQRLENEPDTDEYLSLLVTDKEKVEFLRKVKGYTQRQTAEKLYISERKVRKIENGK